MRIHDGRMLNMLINDALRLSFLSYEVLEEDKIVISHDGTHHSSAYFQYLEG
jgi:hypothetical protein